MFFNHLADKQNMELLGFLADVVETSSNPFVAGRMDGGIITFNQAFMKLTGFNEHELLNYNIHALTRLEIRSEFQFLSDLKENSMLNRSEETELICKDGTRVPINIKFQSMQFPGEHLPIWIAFISDISDRVFIEHTLNYQLELQRLLSAVSSRFVNVNLETVDTEILSTLKDIGSFMGIDRAYVYRIDHIEQIAINTYNCVKKVLTRINARFIICPICDYQWSFSQLFNNNYIYISSIDMCPMKLPAKNCIGLLRI
jgi:PAS domain S-box-containing protein